MISADIIAFRRKYELSQRELGEATGLHRGYISAVECGRREVTSRLEVPVESFMNFVRACERDGRM